MLNKVRRAVEKLIAPGSNLSYSQVGEDLVLDYLTGYLSTGFYVDIGCNHPLKGSNTYRFYRKGWSGICVDANDKFGPMYAAKRPRDSFVRAAVSDKIETVSFHHFAHDGLNSISGERLYDNANHYALAKVEKIETRTLQSILVEQSCPSTFDILTIDVEGYDEQALMSINLQQFRPSVIVFETHVADLARIGALPSANHLIDLGYEISAAQSTNLFFKLLAQS